MSEEELNLIEKFTQMAMLLNRYLHTLHKSNGPSGDPRRGQGRVLSLLKLKPEISQKELCYLLDMRAQSAGELLAKLEKKGLLTRTPAEEDKRVMLVRLTEEGRRAAEEAEEQKMDDGEVFGCLAFEEQLRLDGYLCRITEYLKEKMGGESPESGMDFRAEMRRRRDDFHFGRQWR